MANEELIALLENLQGPDAGSGLNPGLLAQLAGLVAATEQPTQPAGASAPSASALASAQPAAVPAQLLAASAQLAAATAQPKQTAAESRSITIASAASTVASSALQGVSGFTGFGGSNPLGALAGGLTLLPVVNTLLKLFGVGQKEELPPLEKFALPAPIRAEAGLSQSGDTFLIDRGVGDRIRPLQVPSIATPYSGTPSASKQSTASSNITVNVQAMDSQSFMDRREDIARAVREAMLQSHSLNDVVSEL